jgi:hypothetical protein
MDFMMRAKVNRNDWLYYGDTEVQRITRYFVSNSGDYLVKHMLPTADQKAEWHTKKFWRHTVNGKLQMASKAPSKLWVACPPPSAEPPIRTIGIDSGYRVTICNDLTGLDMSDVDISYYVARTRKLVDELILSNSAA